MIQVPRLGEGSARKKLATSRRGCRNQATDWRYYGGATEHVNLEVVLFSPRCLSVLLFYLYSVFWLYNFGVIFRMMLVMKSVAKTSYLFKNLTKIRF